MQMNRVALIASAGLGMAFLAACSDSPTAPSKAAFVPKSSFAVNTITDGPAPVAVRGVVIVCKTGNTGGSFDFNRVAVGASAGTVADDQSIAAGKCLEVADDASLSGIGSNITITEGAAPANTVQTVAACSFIGTDESTGLPTAPESCLGTFSNGGTIFVNSFHGYVITYNNVFTPPETGNEGCTPGYWKQSQHFDSWSGVVTSTTLNSVFGVGGSTTLLEALNLTGGLQNQLYRAGAAAYLNSISLGVDYAYSTADVIDLVQGDGIGTGLTIEQRKDLLDAANNGGCPLN